MAPGVFFCAREDVNHEPRWPRAVRDTFRLLSFAVEFQGSSGCRSYRTTIVSLLLPTRRLPCCARTPNSRFVRKAAIFLCWLVPRAMKCANFQRETGDETAMNRLNRAFVSASFVLLSLAAVAHGQSSNLAATPPMGWNSWNHFAGTTWMTRRSAPRPTRWSRAA